MDRNTLGYDAVAEQVSLNFDLMQGSRTQASRDSSYTPAAISHILTARRRSWEGIKFLIRWYRDKYPGFGDWHNTGILMTRRFPDEPEWRQLLKQKVER